MQLEAHDSGRSISRRLVPSGTAVERRADMHVCDKCKGLGVLGAAPSALNSWPGPGELEFPVPARPRDPRLLVLGCRRKSQAPSALPLLGADR